MYLYLETERLLVRQYTINDIDELHKIMSDVRVHTYTKDINNPWNENRTKEYIKFMIIDYSHQKNPPQNLANPPKYLNYASL